MDTEFSSNFGPQINYIDIIAAQGSGIKYDNLKITSDAQGVLDSLLDISSPFTGSGITEDTNSISDSNSESTDDRLFYAAGAGSVALVGTISYWRVNKKKIQLN